MKWTYFIWWAAIMFQLVLSNWHLSNIRKEIRSIKLEKGIYE